MNQDANARPDSPARDARTSFSSEGPLPIGNPIPWESVLEHFRPYLMAIARRQFPEKLRGKLGVSDLVQDTILRGVENLGTFRGTSREELAVWLRQILLRHIANTVERYSTTKREVGREMAFGSHLATKSAMSPSGVAATQEEWERVQSALGELPEEYRQAVVLRHRENLSFAEIGFLLERSEEAARKLWYRAICRLQEKLGHHEAVAR